MRLEVRGLEVAYGRVQVLRGVDLVVEPGTCVALVGPNGVGKTTLLNCIAGLLSPLAGQVLLDGNVLGGEPAHARVEKGLALVTERRNLFPAMTVRENLRLALVAGRKRGGNRDIDDVLRLFPSLDRRFRSPAGRLSGGEQQMLAIGRALLVAPAVMMIDELSTGLAPKVLHEIIDAVASLTTDGVGLLIVEQNIREISRVADHAYMLELGAITASGPADEVLGGEGFSREFLGLD